jgi:hypothetical protein
VPPQKVVSSIGSWNRGHWNTSIVVFRTTHGAASSGPNASRASSFARSCM